MKSSRRRAAARLLPVTIALIVVACGVTAVNGPASVTIGQNATYDYVWNYGGTVDPPTSTNAVAELTVFIPNGWTVVSATYDGTVNSTPVSGTANTIAPVACVGPAPVGYQAFGFSAGPFPNAVAGDNGVFHITYAVGGVTGSYTLVGRGSATTSSFTGTCGDAAQIDVTVAAGNALTVSKAFSPSTIATGGTSTLRFTLDNTNLFDATGAAFTDTYPAGLVNAAAPAAATTCGGTVTAAPGGNSVSLSGGTVPADSSCTVSVAVTSSATGTYNNTLAAGALTSSNAPPNATPATASLTVTSAAVAVPTLDPRLLALLAVALAAVAFFAMRR